MKLQGVITGRQVKKYLRKLFKVGVEEKSLSELMLSCCSDSYEGVEEFDYYVTYSSMKSLLRNNWTLRLFNRVTKNSLKFTVCGRKLIKVELSEVQGFKAITNFNSIFRNCEEVTEKVLKPYMRYLEKKENLTKEGITLVIDTESEEAENSGGSIKILVKDMTDEPTKTLNKISSLVDDYFYADIAGELANRGENELCTYLDTIKVEEREVVKNGLDNIQKVTCRINQKGSIDCVVESVDTVNIEVFGSVELNLPFMLQEKNMEKRKLDTIYTVCTEDGNVMWMAYVTKKEWRSKKEEKVLSYNLENSGEIAIKYFKGGKVTVYVTGAGKQIEYRYNNGKLDKKSIEVHSDLEEYELSELVKDFVKLEDKIDAQYTYMKNGTEHYGIGYAVCNVPIEEIIYLQSIAIGALASDCVDIEEKLSKLIERGREKYKIRVENDLLTEMREVFNKFE